MSPNPLSVPTTVNQVWSMDFMSDALSDGRKIHTFNVIDDYNREGRRLMSTSRYRVSA